ncbi:MAG: hypothetical protein V3R83_14090, partial [Gammaproteobacteria bacterium]
LSHLRRLLISNRISIAPHLHLTAFQCGTLSSRINERLLAAKSGRLKDEMTPDELEDGKNRANEIAEKFRKK